MSETELPGPILFPVDDEDDDLVEEQTESNDQSPSARSKRDQIVEFLQWSSPSRLYDAKSPQWFLGVFFLGLILIIAFAILQEIWLALFVAAAVFVFYALARVKPTDVDHRILSKGVETAGRLYEWKDLKSFWIYTSKGATILRLDTKLYFPHVLELLLPEHTPQDDLEELEQLIVEYIPLLEKPVSEAGAMADTAILSVANKLPGQSKMLKWLAKNLGIK